MLSEYRSGRSLSFQLFMMGFYGLFCLIGAIAGAVVNVLIYRYRWRKRLQGADYLATLQQRTSDREGTERTRPR
jgi:hypothetical protein